MKKHLLTLALAVTALTANAQNSAIYKVDELIEKGDFAAAAALCDEALANPKTTKFQEFYNKAGQIQIQTFTPELLKATQSIPFDTLAFCTGIDRAVGYYTKSYEATQGVDAKGKPVKWDKKIAEDTQNRLLAMVDFYNYAAMFSYANGDKARALDYFQKYVDYPQNPAFSQAVRDSLNTINRENYAQTRYNLCMLYYEGKNWDALLANAPAALQDHYNNHDIYVAVAGAYLAQGDSANWEKTLVDAATIEGDEGFFNELIVHYANSHQTDKAVAMVNDLVAKYPEDAKSWFMKGCVESDLLNDIEAARKSYTRSLEIDPSYTQAYINMGTTFYNEIAARTENHEFDHFNRGYYNHDTKDAFMAETRAIQAIYQQACDYLEKARASAPDKPELWGRRLQRVYNHMRIVYENLDDKATAEQYQAKYDEVGKFFE